MELYRFRRVDNLLGGFDELESQTIFFSSREYLNDPMEGHRKIYWEGDSILWENLFINYLLSFERLLSVWVVSGEEREIVVESYLPISGGIDDLPTVEYQNLFNKIVTKLKGYESCSKLIDTLGKRLDPVSENELFWILKSLHPVIIYVANTVYLEEGLVNKYFFSEDKLAAIEDIMLRNMAKFASGEIGAKEHHELEHLRSEYTHRAYTNKIEGLINSSRKNKALVLQDFPILYLQNIQRLMYPDWYVACFMSTFHNSASWAHYGDNHSGACLIYRVEEDNDALFLNLRSGNNQGQDEKAKTRRLKFYPVEYSNDNRDVDFFASLGQLTTPQLELCWYSIGDIVSDRYESLFSDESRWRKNYWDMFYHAVTRKSLDWKPECELRLIVSNDAGSSGKCNGYTLKYDFRNLKGLIFGIRMTEENKIKLIVAIKAKCKKYGVKDFELYEAIYSESEKNVQRRKLIGLSSYVNC
ncbi:DUF2971 domain-containing protein [Cobetia marina]|uniref:DUF2971 domain-containing protein n=1 Tax=Cobetia marina TaxID=28258 RepID=UPI00384B6224